MPRRPHLSRRLSWLAALGGAALLATAPAALAGPRDSVEGRWDTDLPAAASPGWTVSVIGDRLTRTSGTAIANGEHATLHRCTNDPTILFRSVSVSFERNGPALTGWLRVGSGGPSAYTLSPHSWQSADGSGATQGTTIDANAQCVWAGILTSGPQAAGSSRYWTVTTSTMETEDTVGPSASVDGVPEGYVTNGIVRVNWSTGENSQWGTFTWGHTYAKYFDSAGNPVDVVDHGVIAPGSNVTDVSASSWPDGRYQVRIDRAAALWATASSSTVAFNVDNAAPSAPSITADRSGWGNADVKVSVSAAATDGSGIHRYQYQVGSGSWIDVPAASSVTFSSNMDAPVQFRAVDNAGRPGAASNSIQVQIDKTAPTITGITSRLVDLDNTRRLVDYTLTDTGGSGIGGGNTTVEAFIGNSWVQVDSAAQGAGASTRSVPVTGLAEGRHSYRVTTRDVAGNTTTQSVAGGQATSFIVDRTAPKSDPIAKALVVTHPNAEVTFTAIDKAGATDDGVGMNDAGPANTTLEVYDGGVWRELYTGTYGLGKDTARFDISSLTPGLHEVRIKFTDHVGNAEYRDVDGKVVNDTTDPSVTGWAFAPEGTDPGKAVLTFTFNDGDEGAGAGTNQPATIECSTNGTNWTHLTDMNTDGAPLLRDGANRHVFPTTTCAEGDIQFRVKVADRAGNTVTRTFTKGDPAFADLPGGGFTVDRTDPSVTQVDITPTTDGTGKATATFTVNDPAPTGGLTNTKNATIEVLDTKLSPQAWVKVCETPVTQGTTSITCDLGPITDQQRTRYRVSVPDTAGNTTVVVSDPDALIVDRTGPSITPDALEVPGRPYDSGLNDRELRARVDLDDNQPIGVGVATGPNAATLQAQNPDGAWVTIGDSRAGEGARALQASPTTPVVEGNRPIRVTVRDKYGNPTTKALGTALIDHTAPTFSGDERAFILPGQRMLIRWGATDGTGVGFHPDHKYLLEGKVRNGTWTTLGGLYGRGGQGMEKIVDVSRLPEGDRILGVTATDAGGRSRTAEMPVTVDRTPPSINNPQDPTKGPAVTYPTPRTAHVCWVIDDKDGTGPAGEVKVEMRMPDGTWRLMASPAAKAGETCIDIDLSGLPEGAYPVRISIEDHAGNQTQTVVQVVVDTQAPLAAITGIGLNTDHTGAINYTLTDGTGSGIDPTKVTVEITEGDAKGGPQGAWRTLTAATYNDNAHEQQVEISTKGLDQRYYAVRVRATDKQANTGVSDPKVLDLRPPDARVQAGSQITPDTKAITQGNDKDTLSSLNPLRFKVVYPKAKPVTVAGTFAGPDKKPLAGQRLELVEYGITRRTITTSKDGHFTVTYTPVAGGKAMVRFPGNEQTGAISLDWQVDVTPYLVATAPRSVKASKGLLIRGTFAPAPQRITAGQVTTTKKPAKPVKGKKGTPATTKKAKAKARKPARPVVRALTAQPVQVYQLSLRNCPKLAKALAKTKKGALPKGVKARCWVGPAPTIGKAVLGQNGKFTVRVRLPKPPAGKYTLYLQVRVPASQGWPFATTRSKLMKVVVRG